MFYPFQSPEPEHRLKDARSIFIILCAITLALSVNTYLYTTHLNTPSQPQTTATEDDSLPTYTLTQVAEHDSATSCWMAAYGNVYNLTEYVADQSHPGGQNQLLSGCGKEMTDVFDRIHSNRAVAQLEEFLIGTLAE